MTGLLWHRYSSSGRVDESARTVEEEAESATTVEDENSPASAEDESIDLLAVFEADETEDGKDKSTAPGSWLKKAVCPAAVIGGVGISGLFGSKAGLSWLDPAIPWLIASAAATSMGRGLVHVRQGKLSRYGVVMRNLTIVNWPLSLVWAGTAALAFRQPDSPWLSILLGIACVALWLTAALQGIVVTRLRAGTLKGAPAYPDIALGTAKVASVEIFHSDVTVGDIARLARQPGRIVQVQAGRTISALVTVMLFTGGLLVGHELRQNVPQDGAKAASSEQSPSPKPSIASAPPTAHSSPSPTGPRSPSASLPAAPTPSTPGHLQYGDICVNRGVEPGTGAPGWAADKLNEAWFGPGGEVAGCAQSVHVIPDKACPSAWEAGINANGDMVSVAIASSCRREGAIYLGHSAAVVQELLADNLPLSGSCRRQVGAGDVQLIYGPFGTMALVRPDLADDRRTKILPPAATAGWARLIANRGVMMWPRQVSSTTWDFVDATGVALDASVHVTFTGGDSKLAQTGTFTDHGVRHPVRSGEQSLASLTPGASLACH